MPVSEGWVGRRKSFPGSGNSMCKGWMVEAGRCGECEESRQGQCAWSQERGVCVLLHICMPDDFIGSLGAKAGRALKTML